MFSSLILANASIALHLMYVNACQMINCNIHYLAMLFTQDVSNLLSNEYINIDSKYLEITLKLP